MIRLPRRTKVLVLGSGAGGAATAATLASRGHEVVVLEEGPHIDTSTMATHSLEAISRLYRNGGVTPILGNQTIAYVEGRCVGGSTEVNSAFWNRPPDECFRRWEQEAGVVDCSPDTMRPYFETLERELSVSYLDKALPTPRSSELFRVGIERMGWRYAEVPRCQTGNGTANQFAPGQKQSMQRTLLPRAVAAGARVFADCKVLRLMHHSGRVTGVVAQAGHEGALQQVAVRADTVFVCCGAIRTAALLRRSGITRNIGNNLCLHPMIKAAALFDEEIGADEETLPVYQVTEWPDITLGGSVFTPGFLAMLLADNWQANEEVMQDWSRMALYYAATRGMSRGTVRNVPGTSDGVVVRYRLNEADRINLSTGLAHLGEVLFAAEARAVYPALRTPSVLTSAEQCHAFLHDPIPLSAMSLSTVHAFSSCPMGENPDLCATDSFGKVNGFQNLYINDASLLPDSPGVNPQATIMALALRNLDQFDEQQRVRRRAQIRSESPPPNILITGAPGWLGTRLTEVLVHGLPGGAAFETPASDCRIRLLVHPALEWDRIAALSPQIKVLSGDLTDAEAVRAFCTGAAGSVLFHIAGVIHPTHGTREFENVNVDGTRNILHAATEAKVRRVVAVSSNSPFGFNPSSNHRFDESSPYCPHMGYGRSKQKMEVLVQRVQSEGNLETVLIRPPWFYGPHQPPRQTLFFRMIRDGRFPILGDGTQMRSMAYVDNICQGLLLAAKSERANGETYWIADERPYSINEIVETVQRVMEEELGITCFARRLRLPAQIGGIARVADTILQAAGLYQQKIHVLGEMDRTIACSIEKAREELGYNPTVALHEGMVRSVRWCLANGIRF